MLHVQIGTFQTVTEVPEITSSAILRQELKKIASMVREHVSETDINARDDSSDPFAQIEYSMINGILGTLDPHSILLPPVDSRQMDEDNKGEFGGLGITIVSREGRLTVEYPLKDTPAEREGLGRMTILFALTGKRPSICRWKKLSGNLEDLSGHQSSSTLCVKG